MPEMVFGIVGAVVGVTGTVLAFVTLIRNKKTDDRDEGREGGVVLTELGNIKRGIDGIEKKLEKQESQYVEVIKQLTAIDISTKQAHKRIDTLAEYHKPN